MPIERAQKGIGFPIPATFSLTPRAALHDDGESILKRFKIGQNVAISSTSGSLSKLQVLKSRGRGFAVNARQSDADVGGRDLGVNRGNRVMFLKSWSVWGLLCVLFGCAPIFAQSTGSITGTVLDNSGAVVSGAE